MGEQKRYYPELPLADWTDEVQTGAANEGHGHA